LDDAPPLQALAGWREIADTMISVPHPYTLAYACQWIATAADELRERRAVHFAIQPKTEPQLIGAIALRAIEAEHSQAELSFWIGVPWWGRGFATEAVRVVTDFGFTQLGLNRLYAHHMARNPNSGRVLEKVGFKPEGLLRQRVRKWDVFEDVVLMAMVRADWAVHSQA
jgi:RimJ/RimL family protein N-acetyltransferase